MGILFSSHLTEHEVGLRCRSGSARATARVAPTLRIDRSLVVQRPRVEAQLREKTKDDLYKLTVFHEGVGRVSETPPAKS